MSTTIEQIEQRISEILLEYLKPIWAANPAGTTEISGATNLVSDLTLDSFQIMEFLMEIEDEYDIAMDMNSLSEIHTIQDLAGAIYPQLKG